MVTLDHVKIKKDQKVKIKWVLLSVIAYAQYDVHDQIRHLLS